MCKSRKIQSVSALCPLVVRLNLYTAIDAILADMETIPGMRQLSISLGLGETFMGGPQGVAATGHQKFLRLVAAGVNVFVPSGDAGSNPDNTGQGPVGPLQVEYAASDPNVVAVGGTTLVLAPDGSVGPRPSGLASAPSSTRQGA
jgi:kumamolisin